MGTQMRKTTFSPLLVFKTIFSTIIFMVFIENSSSNDLGVNGDQHIDKIESHLPFSESNHGYLLFYFFRITHI